MPGKRHQRRQDVLILTETNSVADDRLETEIGYALSQNTVEAWGLNANQQCLDGRPGAKPGTYIQTICERSYKPIQVFNIEDGKGSDVTNQNVNTIASQKEDEAMAFLERRQGKKNLHLIIVGVVAALLAVAIILRMALRGSGPAFPTTLPMAVTAVAVKEKFKTLRTKVHRIKGNGKKPVTPNAMLFIDRTRILKEGCVKRKKIPAGAIPRNIDGVQMYLLNVSKTGKLYKIDIPPKIVENESPRDLYIALNCEDEVDAAYGMEPSVFEKIKLGFMYGVVIIELFILFIWQAAGV